MIDKLIKTAKLFPEVLAIYKIDEHKYLLVAKDKWDLVSSMAYFKMVDEVLGSKIMIKDELKVYLQYKNAEILYALFNETEIDYIKLRIYQKIY